jgi:hypothetical protein
MWFWTERLGFDPQQNPSPLDADQLFDPHNHWTKSTRGSNPADKTDRAWSLEKCVKSKVLLKNIIISGTLLKIILTLEELIQYNDYAIGWTTRKQEFDSQQQHGFSSLPYHPTRSGAHPASFPTGTSVLSLKLHSPMSSWHSA